MNPILRCILILVLLLPTIFVYAQLSFAQLFSDDMVLQRGAETAIWGSATPKGTLKLKLGEHTLQTKANKEGKWKIIFSSLKAGGPYDITVTLELDSITLKNVLIGDVYLASGQSNMEWRIENGISTHENVTDLPMLRYAKMHRIAAPIPADTASLIWFQAVGEQKGKCSAVAYFFAKKLISEENIPIGIIENAIGGSPIEAWISPEMLEQIPAFKQRIQSIQSGKVATELQKIDLPALKEASEEKTRQFRAEASTSALPNIKDRKRWQQITFPSSLERTGLYNFDGNIWLKKEIYWSHETQGKATLRLGRVDDDDHTYLNGIYLGSTYGENEVTEYVIPDDLLKKGFNTILVKLHDRYYNGGLLSPPDQMLLSLEAESEIVNLPLAGSWTYYIPEGEQIDTLYYHYPFFEPTVLYNGSIHPLLNFNFKGALWYQGESNSGRGVQYRDLFERMILDWRIKFRRGNFPFLFVQLANFQKKSDGTEADYWAELREAQAMALDLPNTAMVTAIDLGEVEDIHPRNKQSVGERLALAALHVVYGRNAYYTGSTFASLEIIGDSVLIHFENIGAGLKLLETLPTGFVLAGADQQFYPAKAKIVGANQVMVWSDKVKRPEALRYGWAQNPYLSLFSQNGLPTPPFRTDKWEEKSKYK